jgi:hypothetical protein
MTAASMPMRCCVAFAALCLSNGCGPDREDADPGRRAEPRGRRWAVITWDTAFVIGGPQDTLLQLPTRLAADGAGVSVLDREAADVFSGASAVRAKDRRSSLIPATSIWIARGEPGCWMSRTAASP